MCSFFTPWFNVAFWWFVFSDTAMWGIYKYFMANKVGNTTTKTSAKTTKKIMLDEDDVVLIQLNPVYVSKE